MSNSPKNDEFQTTFILHNFDQQSVLLTINYLTLINITSHGAYIFISPSSVIADQKITLFIVQLRDTVLHCKMLPLFLLLYFSTFLVTKEKRVLTPSGDEKDEL